MRLGISAGLPALSSLLTHNGVRSCPPGKGGLPDLLKPSSPKGCPPVQATSACPPLYQLVGLGQSLPRLHRVPLLRLPSHRRRLLPLPLPVSLAPRAKRRRLHLRGP